MTPPEPEQACGARWWLPRVPWFQREPMAHAFAVWQSAWPNDALAGIVEGLNSRQGSTCHRTNDRLRRCGAPGVPSAERVSGPPAVDPNAVSSLGVQQHEDVDERLSEEFRSGSPGVRLAALRILERRDGLPGRFVSAVRACAAAPSPR